MKENTIKAALAAALGRCVPTGAAAGAGAGAGGGDAAGLRHGHDQALRRVRRLGRGHPQLRPHQRRQRQGHGHPDVLLQCPRQGV